MAVTGSRSGDEPQPKVIHIGSERHRTAHCVVVCENRRQLTGALHPRRSRHQRHPRTVQHLAALPFKAIPRQHRLHPCTGTRCDSLKLPVSTRQVGGKPVGILVTQARRPRVVSSLQAALLHSLRQRHHALRRKTQYRVTVKPFEAAYARIIDHHVVTLRVGHHHDVPLAGLHRAGHPPRDAAQIHRRHVSVEIFRTQPVAQLHKRYAPHL